MNLVLNYEGFEHYMYYLKDLNDGIQYLFKFKNGYGASVVKNRMSYGHDDDLWELAVLEFEDGGKSYNWDITYDTPITEDVEGYLTDEDVRNLLRRIKEL